MAPLSSNLAIPGRLLEQTVQTRPGMSLRNRPDAFIRTMVIAATVRPFWTTLMEMKQARLRVARLVSPPVLVCEMPAVAIEQAA